MLRSASLVEKDEHLVIDTDYHNYDAIVFACFSVHNINLYGFLTLGIFEASIMTSLALLSDSTDSWGIVTTGKFWEKHLSDGVRDFLGQDEGAKNSRFAGVYSTGLSAGDFHSVAPEVVRQRLREATRKLLESCSVGCVVMGCAGMAGLEDIIRSTAVEVYGRDLAAELHVLDAVQAGVLQAELAVRSRRTFQRT
jgi:Asp/Glu/hydantoin racemase